MPRLDQRRALLRRQRTQPLRKPPRFQDADYFTINDGLHPAVEFEFDSNAAFTRDVQIVFTGAETAAQMATLLRAVCGKGGTAPIAASTANQTRHGPR